MKVLLFWNVYIYFITSNEIIAFVAGNAQNECDDTVHKPLGDLAKRSPTYSQDATFICDRHLLHGWYVALHYEMPTTAPDLGNCGATYPYWLNGEWF